MIFFHKLVENNLFNNYKGEVTAEKNIRPIKFFHVITTNYDD